MKINWLWDTQLSEARVKTILKDKNDPRFYIYAEKLFSRVVDPKIAFSYIPREVFCKTWPVISERVQKDTWTKGKADFWQTVYEKATHAGVNLVLKYLPMIKDGTAIGMAIATAVALAIIVTGQPVLRAVASVALVAAPTAMN